MSGLVEKHGRVGVIWFAFTDRPWVQTWTVTPRRPALSRPTVAPYNYPFADNLPKAVTDVQSALLRGQPWLAPLYGQVQLTAVTAGLTATLGWDFWGPSKDVMLFVKPTTARVTAASYVVHTPRSGLQDVVHRFTTKYTALLDSYRRRGLFPVNGGVEIRVTGIDDSHPVPPALSALRPMPGCDTGVWLDVLTFPGTPGAHEFLAELEEFVHLTWPGRYRVEWSKRWGHTPAGAWTNRTVLEQRIPASIPGWQDHVEALNRLDPHRVFTTELHDRLLR